MIKIIIGIVGMFVIFCLLDIRTELRRANYLKEEELELLKKQNRIFEANRL
jgi:hypothetical protein